jgi:hypothetical protein
MAHTRQGETCAAQCDIVVPTALKENQHMVPLSSVSSLIWHCQALSAPSIGVLKFVCSEPEVVLPASGQPQWACIDSTLCTPGGSSSSGGV